MAQAEDHAQSETPRASSRAEASFPASDDSRRSLQAAAAELARRLEELARTLSAAGSPRRVKYGGGPFKRRSPAGFIAASGDLQLLLPDGRLWNYSKYFTGPTGRYFDAKTDFGNFIHSRLQFGGASFVFLGANLAGYSFGAVFREGEQSGDAPAVLGAVASDGESPHLIDAGEAFADLSEKLQVRRRGHHAGQGVRP